MKIYWGRGITYGVSKDADVWSLEVVVTEVVERHARFYVKNCISELRSEAESAIN